MKRHKTAIVTGGTRGIGAAISLCLAKEGISVLAVYRSHAKEAAAFHNAIREISTDSVVCQGDVGTQSGVDHIIDYAISSLGQIDILINNAGMFDFKYIEEMNEEFLQTIMNVNFFSQVRIIKACIPHMKKRGYGRIVNASSVSSSIADIGLTGYGASKASVDVMTKICAAELAPYQITVNAYAPGIIHTDLTDSMIHERGEIQKKQIPLLRFGQSEEVASLIAYLVSEEAGYITGEIIGVDGGMMKVQNPYRAHLEK